MICYSSGAGHRPKSAYKINHFCKRNNNGWIFKRGLVDKSHFFPFFFETPLMLKSQILGGYVQFWVRGMQNSRGPTFCLL